MEAGFLFALIILFMPAIVGSVRGHRNRLAIDMLNVIAVGPLFAAVFFAPRILWLITLFIALIPWVVAMVWACTSNTNRALREQQALAAARQQALLTALQAQQKGPQ